MRRSCVVLLVVAVGCTNQIDRKKVEDSIRETATAKQLPLKSLACPSGIKIQKGGTFKCDVSDDQGTSTTITVTMTDGEGTISWDLDGKIVNMKKLGDDMEAKIVAGGGAKDVDVKCPTKSFIAKKGCKFTCDATAGGQAGKIDFTCTDDEGNLDYKIE